MKTTRRRPSQKFGTAWFSDASRISVRGGERNLRGWPVLYLQRALCALGGARCMPPDAFCAFLRDGCLRSLTEKKRSKFWKKGATI